VRFARETPAVARTPEGALGAARGVLAAEAKLQDPVPAAVIAATRTMCGEPLMRPLITVVVEVERPSE
jgi:hypothetical protein